jgi:hypothetical protein
MCAGAQKINREAARKAKVSRADAAQTKSEIVSIWIDTNGGRKFRGRAQYDTTVHITMTASATNDQGAFTAKLAELAQLSPSERLQFVFH